MAMTKRQRTLMIIKPDGVQRGLMGEILGRFERTGLKYVGMKFMLATEEQCWAHYNKDDKWFLEKGSKIAESFKTAGMEVSKEPIEYGRDIIRQLASFMTSGPVLAAVIEGNEAVGIVKKLVGGTEPLTSDVGTIRGDLTLDSYYLSGIDGRAVRNLVHCSDSAEEAEREIKLWFNEGEFFNYRLMAEQILYDVNLDGILDKEDLKK